MSTPSSDEESLLRSAGYYPEPSASPPTLHPTDQQDHYQSMASSSTSAYDDLVPRYSSPVSARSNIEPHETSSAGFGITQPVRSSQGAGSRAPSPNLFNASSSRAALGLAGYPNPFENSYIENGSGTQRFQSEREIGTGRNKFPESHGLPAVTIDEVPRATLAARPMSTTNDEYDNDNLKPSAERSQDVGAGCPAHHDIHSRRYSWLSISIITLSIYSTIWSGIWLVLAVAQPRYGRLIHSGGKLSPSTASIVFALLAKTIELSFVTVFITFLGQVLSRRSLIKSSRGVTIAEMTMRTWVIQPGFMITHFQNLQHAGLTFLGLISLTAALLSMFYTTASDAIVSPQLRFGKTQNLLMYGVVNTSYANPMYVSQNCLTPITTLVDPLDSGETCLSYQHAGQSYHNAISFLATWAKIENSSVGVSSNIVERPPAPGMLFDNTTVTGSWVAPGSSNMTAAYEKYHRIVNNVTLSMPHAGLFSAARDPKNNILQPDELEGLGEYKIEASVVSPTVNVLCANMNKTAAAPLVYTTWPNAHLTNTTSMPGQALAWSGYQTDIQILPGKSYLNSTDMDDVFEWGAKYGRQPPIFPMFPIEYNAITNISVFQDDSLYTLFKAPDYITSDYTICQLRSYLSTSCSSIYNVSGLSGGQMTAHCEDAKNPLAYDKSVSKSVTPWNTDWRNVAQDWMQAMSLNTGSSNANSSTSRLLSQLILSVPASGPVQLAPLTPSISELMAVMVGNTLLLSTTDSTFFHYWNATYPKHILNPGRYEQFNASMSSQEYTSGLQQQWQAIFYIVLVFVFIANVFCLIYFFVRHGLVTDYTEPSNLFALAVNSPPSRRLDGSCGAGPEGHQLDVDWHVMAEASSGHFFMREGQEKEVPGNDFELRRRTPQNVKSIKSYSKLSSRSSSFL